MSSAGDAPPSARYAHRRNGTRRWTHRRLWLLAMLGVVVLCSGAAVTVSAGVPARQVARQHLGPPTNLYAFGSGDAVVLSWQPPPYTLIGYRIYRAANRYSPYTIVGSVNAADMDTFTDSGDLTPGTTYAYTVTAYDRQGESAPAGPIVAVVLASPATPSPAPAGATPLPTFAPVAPPTLTAVARLSRGAGRPPPTPVVAPSTGVAPVPTPVVMPTTAVSPVPTPVAVPSTGIAPAAPTAIPTVRVPPPARLTVQPGTPPLATPTRRP